MEFERARTKEQKDVRISEIVEAAIKQYNEIPYEKITLASIAKELSFSRVNLYKYFNNKEEIFLKIVELDLFRWVDKLKLIFISQKSKDLESFAAKFSAALFSQKRMIELMTKLFSELEKNTSVEKLAGFKMNYFELHSDLFGILAEQLPQLSEEKMTELMLAQNAFVMGLYPISKMSENQKMALELAGSEYEAPDFVKTLSQFIVTYVNGLMAK